MLLCSYALMLFYYSIISLFHFFIFSLFYYFIISLFHYFIISLFHCSIVPLFHYSIISLFHYYYFYSLSAHSTLLSLLIKKEKKIHSCSDTQTAESYLEQSLVAFRSASHTPRTPFKSKFLVSTQWERGE
jgi:hypothetical protein